MIEKLTPSYRQYLQRHSELHLTNKIAPGCKRIIVDPGYLDAIRQPNVTLNWDGIDKIVEEGIKTKTGEIIELDAIIFGTGYVIVRRVSGAPIDSLLTCPPLRREWEPWTWSDATVEL